MATKTNIQWTDVTWNIAVGCDKVDADCKNCYMYRDSLNSTRYTPNQVRRTKTVFDLPLKYKETKSTCWDGPPLVFTCSLTDFFHPSIDSYRHEAWDIIRRCPHLIFQILTKRPERIKDHLPADWGNGWDNVWLGTSIGSPKGINRILHLLSVKCKTRFLSIEPYYEEFDLTNLKHELCPPDFNFTHLFGSYKIIDCLKGELVHGKVGYNCNKINWVIVGGESGNDNGKYNYRKCHIAWIEKIVNDCKQNNIPVFVKQLGTYLATELNLSDRHGGNINEFPPQVQVREFPKNI